MKNNLSKFLLTIALFAGMVLSTFWQLITSNLRVKVLVEKKESLAGTKVFIEYLISGTAYVTSVLKNERYSLNSMNLQHLFL